MAAQHLSVAGSLMMDLWLRFGDWKCLHRFTTDMQLYGFKPQSMLLDRQRRRSVYLILHFTLVFLQLRLHMLFRVNLASGILSGAMVFTDLLIRRCGRDGVNYDRMSLMEAV